MGHVILLTFGSHVFHHLTFCMVVFFTMCVCACSVDWLLLASCLCCSSGSIIVSREVAVTHVFHKVSVPALGVLASWSLPTSQCASYLILYY